jgi:hypothetical protein
MPVIQVVPQLVSFADVGVGETGMQTLSIVNGGVADLTVTLLDLTPESSPDFHLTSSLTLPLLLLPGESATFDVHFTPTSFEPVTGVVKIASNDPQTPTAIVALSGNGPCDNSEEKGLTVCGDDTVPDGVDLRLSTITVAVVFVDCWIDFIPNQLNGAGHGRHTVLISFCVHKDDNGTVTPVRLEDIASAPDTFKLNLCGAQRGCVDERNVVEFGNTGITPLQTQWLNQHQRKILKLTYLENDTDLNRNRNIDKEERGLFARVCLEEQRRHHRRWRLAGVIGQVAKGDFAGAILRGHSVVWCHQHHRGPWDH